MTWGQGVLATAATCQMLTKTNSLPPAAAMPSWSADPSAPRKLYSRLYEDAEAGLGANLDAVALGIQDVEGALAVVTSLDLI